MNEYIFYTTEGFTYPPIEGKDVENCQVLGQAFGNNVQDAKTQLEKRCPWIKDCGFDDFALGNGHMVILTPEETAHYLLKKGTSVTISLNANDECYVECGVINEGKVIETKTEKNQYHEYSFEITEEGNYNFYVMYYSVDKSIFTKCVIDIK